MYGAIEWQVGFGPCTQGCLHLLQGARVVGSAGAHHQGHGQLIACFGEPLQSPQG